jgi:hypothetical protein
VFVGFDRLSTLLFGTAFWTAVALPLAYVPVLVRGHSTGLDPLTVAPLLAVHVVAIVVGQYHGRAPPPARDESPGRGRRTG